MTGAHGLLAALACLMGCASGSSGLYTLPAPSEAAMLQPGDSVRILVWRNPEMSGAFVIDRAGRPTHPLYRRIPVADRPVDEVRRDIEAYLGTIQQDPQVVLEARLQVSLTGEVRLPGRYWVPPEATIGQLLASAGGATDRAEVDGITVRRGNALYRVDLTSPANSADALRVVSGDEIVVPRRPGSPLVIIGVLSSLASLAASLLVLAGL